MIETFFSLGTLASPRAFLAAFVIGLLFGLALERAGFGSSRRLAAVFYFKDMAVVKVMFTAVITAMLGLCYCTSLGIISVQAIYLMPTVYGAQIVGGLLFGIGFVMSGWCPGTAAVGLGSGKLDAFVFLIGTIVGSILFNELFALVKPLYELGNQGVLSVYDSLHVSQPLFALLFTLVAIGAFWGSEAVERKITGHSAYLGSRFLKVFSCCLLIVAVGLFAVAIVPEAVQNQANAEQSLLAQVAQAEDHLEPETLAERLMNADASLLVVDIRSAAEFQKFHIKGARHIELSDLTSELAPYQNRGTIVLYSNGMTHPAQARDALARLGYRNVYLLTDGLAGFVERCLKPVSLRSEIVPPDQASKINAWRKFFEGK